MAWAAKQRTGDPASKLVLLLLANYAGADFTCWPSQKTIAESADCSLRSVIRYIDALAQQGFITRTERRRKDGSKATDLITLCVPDLSQGDNLAASSQQGANLSGPPDNLSKVTCQIGTYIKDEPINEPITEPSCMDAVEFEDLLNAYTPFQPRDNRSSAIGVWKTLTPEEQADAVRHAKAICAGEGGFPPYLVIYLRERRWRSLPTAARAIAVEYVFPGTKRWDEVKRETGKSDASMFLSRSPSGREAFAYYPAQPVKQGAAA